MKSKLIYSKGDIDKAGKVLAGEHDSKITIDSAIEILENFRALHIHPMLVFRMLLQRKSNSVISSLSFFFCHAKYCLNIF